MKEIKIRTSLKDLSEIVYGTEDNEFGFIGKEGFNTWLKGVCEELQTLYNQIDNEEKIDIDHYLLGDAINLLRAIIKV